MQPWIQPSSSDSSRRKSVDKAKTLTKSRGRDALLVEGRMYDVATRHVAEAVHDFIESAAKTVLQIHNDPKACGDVLVFMPGTYTTSY